MVDEILFETEEKMEHSLEALGREFSGLRTGRASASFVERINVDYYGSATPITQLAGIKTPDAHLLVIEPWDKTILKDIEKAIMASDLGITPSNDGVVIRLPFPAPTEERRKELVKQCKSAAEDARVALRNVRRDANARLERAKKDGDISEDDMRRAEEKVQKLTDKFVAKVDEAFKKKESEVMEV